jgi:hypothetical protein
MIKPYFANWPQVTASENRRVMKSDKELKTRREFLRQSAAAAVLLGGALPASARDWEDYSARFSGALGDSLPDSPLKPDDEGGWKAIAKNYDVTTKITNLENGYWGIMAIPVLGEYKQLTEFINKETPSLRDCSIQRPIAAFAILSRVS